MADEHDSCIRWLTVISCLFVSCISSGRSPVRPTMLLSVNLCWRPLLALPAHWRRRRVVACSGSSLTISTLEESDDKTCSHTATNLRAPQIAAVTGERERERERLRRDLLLFFSFARCLLCLCSNSRPVRMPPLCPHRSCESVALCASVMLLLPISITVSNSFLFSIGLRHATAAER